MLIILTYGQLSPAKNSLAHKKPHDDKVHGGANRRKTHRKGPDKVGEDNEEAHCPQYHLLPKNNEKHSAAQPGGGLLHNLRALQDVPIGLPGRQV
jgi:hypothetical protein